MYQELYKKQVGLLIEVLPIINKFSDVFALKGGTAINLFHSDMPRLSVDIDLTYIKSCSRTEAYNEINSNILKMKELLLNKGFDVIKQGEVELKLIIIDRKTNTQIKIEPNYVIRATLYPNVLTTLCQKAVKDFNMEYSVYTVSKADLYAGKIAAALSRRHPRDLFDIKQLINQGNASFSVELLNATAIYLSSNSRPIHELLNPTPNFINLELAFEKQFQGMVLSEECTIDELKETYMKLLSILNEKFDDNHRRFIMSIVENNANYNLLDGIEETVLTTFSGLSWKLLNLKKLQEQDMKMFSSQIKATAKILSL